MKLLIVFYSRSGTTRTLAGRLQKLLNCDLQEVKPLTNYRGLFGLFRAGYHTGKGIASPYAPVTHDPGQYDRVIIGFPVWGGNLPAPMRTFVEDHQAHIKRLAVFATGGNPDTKRVMDNLGLYYRDPVDANLFLRRKHVKRGQSEDALRGFVEKVLS